MSGPGANATGATPPVVLTVAGTDSGGAAGIAADLATIGHLGAHGACVVSAVTAQDTLGVRAVHPVSVEVVAAQLDAVFGDLPVAAVKTGMLGSAEVVELVARRVRAAAVPLVVDPVLVATSGAVLGGAEVVRAYREHLLPVATVATPNSDEALALLGHDAAPSAHAEERELAEALAVLGHTVLVTGGESGSDWLAAPGEHPLELAHTPVRTTNDHGTGCTHSSALATLLAHGTPLVDAARLAAAYTSRQLAVSSEWRMGRGRGPVAHTSPSPLTAARRVGADERGTTHAVPEVGQHRSRGLGDHPGLHVLG